MSQRAGRPPPDNAHRGRRAAATDDAQDSPPLQDEDWVYGVHAVQHLLDAAPGRVRRLWIGDGRRGGAALSALLDAANAAQVPVERVRRAALDRVAPGVHQGVAAQCHAIAPATEKDFERRFASFQQPLLLILEGVQDPRNLGACLRTADAAGVDAVLLHRRHAAGLTSAVAKAASGALERLFIVSVANIVRRMAWLKARGVWIVGGDERADTSLFDCELPFPLAIALGGEGGGLRRLTRERCDLLVRVPMAGAVSSLNVAVAAGVLLFEAARRRR